MADDTFRAIITAVDKATPVLDRIGTKIKAVGAYADLAATKNPWGEAAAAKVSLFTRALDGAHAAGARLMSIGEPFRHAMHPVRELGHLFGEMGEKIKGIGEKIAEVAPILGTLGGAASVAGMFELIHKISESFSELAHSAATIGITTAAMQRLSYEAKMTDTPLESMQTGLFRFNRAIADSAAGKNKDAAALFHHLGIATRDASGHLVSATDILPRLQEAFAKTTDPAMRARMAMALFGRGGKEMLPFLLASKEQMAEWSEQADRLVYPFTPQDAKNLEDFKGSWIGLGAATSAFGDELGAKLAPILTPIMNQVKDWIAAHRDEVIEKITRKVAEFRDYLKSIDWDKVIKSTEGWMNTLGWLLDKIGGVKGAVIGLVAVMAAPWVVAVTRVVGTLFRILIAATRLTWALGTGLVGAIGEAGGAFAALSARVMGLPLWGLLARFSGIGTFIAGMWPGTANPVNGPAEQDPAFRNRRNGVPIVFHDELNAPASRQDDTPPGSGPWSNPRQRADWSHDVYASPGNEGAGWGDRGVGMLSVWDRLRNRLGGSQNGKVDVHVVIDGAPAGTSARATGTGITSDPTLDVGYAFPGMIPAN